MKREIVEKLLHTLYPEKGIKIVEYETHERHIFYNDEWVLDEPAIFLKISFPNNGVNVVDLGGSISETLFKFTGFEFSITRI